MPIKWFAKLKNMKLSTLSGSFHHRVSNMAGQVGSKIMNIPAVGNIPIEFILFFAQAFLVVNAGLFVQVAEIASYRTVIMIYMLLLIGFRVFAGKGIFPPTGFGRGFMWFMIGLLGGTVILTGGGWLTELGTFEMARSAPLVLLLTQSLVVAASEEKIFRDYAPAVIGIVPAQLAFAAFHGFAYGLAVTPILMALFAGFLFYFIARYTSLWSAVGLHTAWNLFSLGALSMLFGGI